MNYEYFLLVPKNEYCTIFFGHLQTTKISQSMQDQLEEWPKFYRIYEIDKKIFDLAGYAGLKKTEDNYAIYYEMRG